MKCVTKATTISITNAGSVGTAAALPVGIYLVTSDVDAYFEMAAGAAPTAAAPAANSGSMVLWAKGAPLKISFTGEFAAGRCVSAANGTIWIQPCQD